MNDDQALAVAPQPFAPVPGVSVAFSLGDLVELGKALDDAGRRAPLGVSWPAHCVAHLVAGDALAVRIAARLGLKNPDGSKFAGEVDAIQCAAVVLGEALADGVWRRVYGEPLPPPDFLDGGADD